MTRRIASLVLSSLSLSLFACGGDDAPSDVIDAAMQDVDAGTGPADDGGRAYRDAGPIVVPDPGACETWGLDDEGDAITGLEEGTWTFVPFPDAHCMNGSSTGIGVNLAPGGSDRLVIYLEGGGACFDSITCSGVAGINGFDGDDLAGSSGQISNYGIFRRGDEANPMRDWNYVYVPYCTGDAHAGTNPDGFEGREQVGFDNVHEYLRRLVPTFRESELVLLTGASAGGLGAFANFDQVQQAFGCTPVHMLDDSGPVLDDEYLRPCLQSIARDYWGLAVPADCTACTADDGGGLSAVWTYLALKYPDRRFGFLSSTADRTFRTFFGYGLSPRCNFPQSMSAAMFEEGVIDLRDRILGPHDNFRTFYQEGDFHTFVGRSLGSVSQDGTTLGAWVGQLIDGDEAWSNVGP
ncbi:pectin acetylesterase-family hydrolase [Sandaracinus amylolyticus]|uniref:Pectinacetylesterase n=1 Tax=Sandaracinus amylolyticus TaxID=927083 RepID=A0A0F6SH68_9BACT|nr:pectin acetylesterase-family hydrolase [Sandaracinus amylolyticus]AKF09919.1 Hypothetical protein DB32_007068 [Sandaracinus amylolyticus]